MLTDSGKFSAFTSQELPSPSRPLFPASVHTRPSCSSVFLDVHVQTGHQGPVKMWVLILSGWGTAQCSRRGCSPSWREPGVGGMAERLQQPSSQQQGLRACVCHSEQKPEVWAVGGACVEMRVTPRCSHGEMCGAAPAPQPAGRDLRGDAQRWRESAVIIRGRSLQRQDRDPHSVQPCRPTFFQAPHRLTLSGTSFPAGAGPIHTC